MTYKLSSGDSIFLMEELGSGGEAAVYHVANRPGVVAKIYHPSDRRPEREPKLRAMIARPPEDPARSRGHTSIAWPTDLIFDEAGLAGFVMPAVANAKPLAILFNPLSRRAQAPGVTWRHLVTVARNISAVLASMHRAGYVVGDLSGNNFMVSRESLITLIDADSVQVSRQGHLYPCPVGTQEFTPPELIGTDFSLTRREESADCFALAVLLFQLVMEGYHPFQGIWQGSGDLADAASLIRVGAYAHDPRSHTMKPPPLAPSINTLPSGIVELFSRAFVTGHNDPARRPTAADWTTELTLLSEHLVECSASRLHSYSASNVSCPWCARAKTLGEDFWAPPPPQPTRTSSIPRPTAEPRPVPTPARPSATTQQGFWARLANWLRTLFGGQPRTTHLPPKTPPRPQPRPTSTPRPRPSRASPAPQQGPQVIANSFTGKFHRQSCEWASRISGRNRVYLSVTDATQRGMVPCRVCRPR